MKHNPFIVIMAVSLAVIAAVLLLTSGFCFLSIVQHRQNLLKNEPWREFE